jgi:tetratricopeptide (TPR) repeat protein
VKTLLNDADGEVATCSVDGLFNQAVTHHEAGEWALALRCFSTVLRLEPARADAAFNIATTLHMLGYTRLAVDYTEKVSRLGHLDFSYIFSSHQASSPSPLTTEYRR